MEWDDETELRMLLEMLVPAAQSQFDATLRDSDAGDTKALAILAIDTAAVGVLVAVHGAVNRWWLPAGGFTAGALFLLASIWPRTFDLGPDLRSFYSSMPDETPLESARRMLALLVDSEASNRKDGKVFLLSVGLTALLMSLLGLIPIALLGQGPG